MERFKLLLKDDKLDEWAVGTMDDDRIFINSQASSESILVFCFVPLCTDPFLAIISDLSQQFKDQGFIDESISQAQYELYARIRTILAFTLLKGEIKFEASVASLQVQLRTPVIALNHQLASKLFQKVLQVNLRKASLLQGISDDLLNLIDAKDKAIEYLDESVQEMGGQRIIAKWAPPGSYNARLLERYLPPAKLLGCLEYSRNIMKSAESLLKLEPEFRNYTRSPSRSPRKRYRDLTATNLTDRLQRDVSISTTLARSDSRTPKRATSESPSKRQKFGKVKVMKK